MIIWRKPDRIAVSVSPPDRLDRVRFVEPRAQRGAVANALPRFCRVLRVRKSPYSGPRLLYAEGFIPACRFRSTRREYVLAQSDVLTGDIGLIEAAIIVKPNDPAVRRRALRPVDPASVEGQLLGRMIASRQTRDERTHDPRVRIDDHDARAAVLPAPVGRLVRVAREQPASLEAAFEGDVD